MGRAIMSAHTQQGQLFAHTRALKRVVVCVQLSAPRRLGLLDLVELLGLIGSAAVAAVTCDTWRQGGREGGREQAPATGNSGAWRLSARREALAVLETRRVRALRRLCDVDHG